MEIEKPTVKKTENPSHTINATTEKQKFSGTKNRKTDLRNRQ